MRAHPNPDGVLSSWIRHSVSRVRRDGLRGAVESLRHPYTLSLQQFGDVRGKGTPIYAREWDVLIVLDACRTDLMREVQSEFAFLEDLRTIWSVGSVTKEWMSETFRAEFAEEMARTAYICGNPHSSTSLDESAFYLLDETWRRAWDRTIPPRALTDSAIEVWREQRPPRMIVHYMQPHCPFIPWGDEAQAKSVENFGNQDTKDVWQRLRDRELTREHVWDGYRENLRVVLEDVELLLDNLDAADVVITSDHGNALGEWGIYGHKPSLPFRCLREVPWVRTTAVDTGAHEPDYEYQDSLEVTTTEQLEALGYR